MMSASAVINNILVQLNECVTGEMLNEIKMILYMNLCDYTFTKNMESTELLQEVDKTYEIVKNWHNQLIIEGKTIGTIKNYESELRKLIDYTGLGVTEIKEHHINSYLANGKIRLKWKDKTYNSKVRSIRAFFKWAYEYDIITQNPMKRIKETKEEFRMGAVLSPEQREIMRCTCKTERELAIVDLLYSSGGRISEICQLNRENIDFANRRMIIFGKGRKEREIYFSAQTRVHLMAYLESRTDNNPALFVGKKAPHPRMGIAGIQWLLKSIQSRDKRLKGLKITPHTFRRTCGTDMINRGAPAEMVQKKLGHQNINTTLTCYARISTETVRDAERRYGAA